MYSQKLRLHPNAPKYLTLLASSHKYEPQITQKHKSTNDVEA